MEEFAFDGDLFQSEGVTPQQGKEQRIAQRKAQAAGYVARIDTADRLVEDTGYVAAYIKAHPGKIASHELRRLEGICSRLYVTSRYMDCLYSALALLRWRAKVGPDCEDFKVDDEELADLVMRSSARCGDSESLLVGCRIARASKHLWSVFAGLALSAAKCFEQSDQCLEAASAYAAYLLLRGPNVQVAHALLALFESKASDDATKDLAGADIPDKDTLKSKTRLNDGQASKLHEIVFRSMRAGQASTMHELADEATSGGRHDRSVRTL